MTDTRKLISSFLPQAQSTLNFDLGLRKSLKIFSVLAMVMSLNVDVP